jgi:hypothetical protein
MDSDIKQILDLAERMKVTFKKLEARQMVSDRQYQAIRSAANMYRFFEGTNLSELRAAFDPEYAAQMKRLTKIAKNGA